MATRSWQRGHGLVVALADGHGSRDSFRSDVGASLAAEDAVGAILEWLETSAEGPSVDELSAVVPRLSRELATRWTRLALEHLAADPVSDAELAESPRGRSGHESDPLRAYGSTLLLAVLTARSALLLQLGDGDILMFDMSGAVVEPVPHDSSLIANETTSLCLPDAWTYMRSAVLEVGPEAPFQLLLLATDGYGNSFADTTWRDDVMRDLATHVHSHGLDWVGARLESWIGESADVAGDDVSVALVRLEPL